ncbi:MAG TPA: alpha-galactosidase [Candidatus Atribacteria bacterium]|nr:alpha-galactosidase [Candidatus Atribacteria bacterium]
MIDHRDGVFRLTTANTSYWFRVTRYGHLEHVYYGERLQDQPIDGLLLKRTAMTGTSIAYDPSDPNYCLDNIPLEWSGIGRGDYRHSPAELKMPDGSFVNDFVYKSHRILPGCMPAETLPTAYGNEDECRTLELTMMDGSNDVVLLLYYTVFYSANVITRRAVLKNVNTRPLVIRRLMSMMTDLPDKGFHMITLDGGWIKEAHRHEKPVQYGMYVNSSTTGNSSNRHNPGFLLAARCTDELHGPVYGFNLIYSGNHYGAVEKSSQDIIRVMLGINPHCFEWILKEGEAFETPEAVMTYSSGGLNGMSHNFHDFVNNHIVRGEWKNKERPVLINSWEAYFFKFTQGRLLRLARRARRLGIELFVLDDGWFGKRDSDNAGLGDYNVNRKKLPGGIAGLARRIKRMGMDFGLWFEPEMVNPDSGLYRAHPEWAVKVPGKEPVLGRNQLVLDLCNPDVRDHIVASVGKILDEAGISYVKWDMNRHIAEAFSPCIESQGEFFHRYILGLYDILKRIFGPRPHILLETCASGGNRFDLGMLCFSPQIWASDDTDPIERLKIQGGLSLFYPLSAMGAHVSAAPHHQTLRDTPLSTRFNVAAFGCLGYELDLKYLSFVERREIKNQIAFYKRYRRTFQYGRFYRLPYAKGNKVLWQCMDGDGSRGIALFAQTLSSASEGYDYLPLAGLDREANYRVTTRPQSLFIKRFGGLVKHIMPVTLDPDGMILRTANRYYCLTDCVEAYEGKGDLLMQGIRLNNQFIGSYYNPQTRLLGDFGSNLYIIERL